MLAKYECFKCKHTWEEKPKPVVCPECKHLYVHWLNYKEWKIWHDNFTGKNEAKTT